MFNLPPDKALILANLKARIGRWRCWICQSKGKLMWQNGHTYIMQCGKCKREELL